MSTTRAWNWCRHDMGVEAISRVAVADDPDPFLVVDRVCTACGAVLRRDPAPEEAQP